MQAESQINLRLCLHLEQWWANIQSQLRHFFHQESSTDNSKRDNTAVMTTKSMLTHETKYYSTAFLIGHIRHNISNFLKYSIKINVLLTSILLQQVTECITIMIISIITIRDTKITFSNWRQGPDQRRLLCCLTYKRHILWHITFCDIGCSYV